MVTWAGWLITACGVGHSVGALVQVLPRHAGAWLDGALWQEQNRDLLEMTPVMSGFWFSVNSFGVPLILLGLAVVWAGRRGTVPPPALAWALGAWTLVGEISSGPSPLSLLVVAAALLVLASRRAGRGSVPART